MRERAESIGASLQIESQPSHGTRIEVHWRRPQERTR
jgi:signal transduction histidine kinase